MVVAGIDGHVEGVLVSSDSGPGKISLKKLPNAMARNCRQSTKTCQQGVALAALGAAST